jgi:hypothetical protein
MLTKIFLLAFLLAGCGNNIQLKPNQLESQNSLSDSQIAAYQKQGLFTKGEPSRIVYQNRSYNISKYSSKVTQDFIKSAPLGGEIPIVFIGGIEGNQIVVEGIKRK